MSTVSTNYFATVNRMLRAERADAYEAVIKELERLCGLGYCTAEWDGGGGKRFRLEPGLRLAISAVKRLEDSKNLHVADPDAAQHLEVWDEVPFPGQDAGRTRRRSVQAGVDGSCSDCGHPYRRSATAAYVCVHAADCARGRKLAA